MTTTGTLAITDHNNMSGIVDHYRACKEYGIKPIYGMDATTEAGHHLTLLAKDQMGLTNLFRLSKTNKSYADLDSHRTGIIALSGDMKGAIPESILRKDRDGLNFHLKSLQDIYKRDFYLEVIDHGLREQRYINSILDKINVPKVRTNDVHFLNEEDAPLHSILLCDRLKRRLDLDLATYHTITKAYLNELPEDPVAREISDKCNLNLRIGDVYLPTFKIPGGHKNEYAYLKHLVYEGLKLRLPDATDEYYDRVKYELSVIRNMGFPGYFLIVWDFVAFAHNNGIPVGPGRGSGAGSLVAYCLRITDLDPIKYRLLFERFLNPERVSMPDFDIDFCMSRRAEVIKYVVNKYGDNSVCQIATFSELKPRSAWHAAARVLGVHPVDADRFSKLLPEPPKDEESLSDIYENGYVKAGAAEKYKNTESTLRENPSYRPIIDMASRLEGAYRSVGRGAAGVLISNGDLSDYIPVWDTQGKDFPIHVADEESNVTRYVSQLDKTESEKMGLVKFDFLGLAELDVIDYTLTLIRNQEGLVPDMSKISLEDPKVFELISSGRTIGMFQVSSPGMSQMVRQMKASSFEDIVAAVALYRPGPMDAGMDRVYILRKNGEPFDYLHPDLEAILDTTYGVIVYQEQVMEIARVICGYTLGGADLLRRAMGKKKPEEMAKQHDDFIIGGSNKGYDSELLDELWRQIETFARYGFNRSHAAAYAMITYHTAWLKAHYPAELLAAQMQVRRDSFKSVAMFIEDAKSMGIAIVEPDVNKSPKLFSVRDGKILVGLAGLKNISDIVAYEIEKNAPFNNLTEFFSSIKMDKGSFDSLVHSGAFDRFLKGEIYQARADFLAQSQKFTGYIRKNDPNQGTLFADLEILFETGIGEEPNRREVLEFEREYLGRYRSGHPVDAHRAKASSLGVVAISDMIPEDGRQQMICGIVTEISEIPTKNNDLMAFVRMEDETGGIDISVFPKEYNPSFYQSLVGEIVFVVCEMSHYKGSPSPFCVEIENAKNHQ